MQNAAAASNTKPNNLSVLIDMGFSEEQSRSALRRTDNLDEAIAFLLNDQLPTPSPPSSPGVSQPDSSEDETSYTANPRCMQFVVNIAHPTLSFSTCLTTIAQASFDLYDEIMVDRLQLLAFKNWRHRGEVKELFECIDANQLRDLSQQFDQTFDEHRISTALVTDGMFHEPVCLALFGQKSYLEQYTSHFKQLTMCPSRFFLNQDDQKPNESVISKTTTTTTTTQ